jgi:hypothetical protein
MAAAAATVAAVAPITSTRTTSEGDTVASMASSTSCGGVTPSCWAATEASTTDEERRT